MKAPSSKFRDKSSWVVIAHNIRSAHNVGGIFRTADGAGAEKVYLTGYSATPAKEGAIYKTASQKMISKTALGAERTMLWEYTRVISILLNRLRGEGYTIIALEQDSRGKVYTEYDYPEKTAIIVGNEPRGIDYRTLAKCDAIVEIPMYGLKNSLNVVVALGIVGYTINNAKLKMQN